MQQQVHSESRRAAQVTDDQTNMPYRQHLAPQQAAVQHVWLTTIKKVGLKIDRCLLHRNPREIELNTTITALLATINPASKLTFCQSDLIKLETAEVRPGHAATAK